MARSHHIYDIETDTITTVPFTAEEEEAADAEAAASSSRGTLLDTYRDNRTTLHTQLSNRLGPIRAMRAALQDGTIFALNSEQEKQVIDTLLLNSIRLVRLVTDLLDDTN